MARKKAAAAKKGTVNVNFKGVESRRTPPEGDYKCTVLEATAGVSSNKNDQIEIVAEISAGEYKGQKLYMQFPLLENSLWKLHAFLTALGMDVPEDELEIDLNDLVGEDFMGVVSHETYNGRKKAKLTDFDSLDNYEGPDGDDEDEDDEDEKPAKKGKKAASKKSSKKSKKDDDDEDEDEDEEEEAPAKKSKKKAPAKKGKKVVDEDEDDDEDEDEKPAKKSKGKKSKKKTYDRDDVEDMDEDELQELLEEAGLEDEVDLDDYKKLPKKVAAVIEALEEAELLDD